MFVRVLLRLVVVGLVIAVTAKILPGMHVTGGLFTYMWLALLLSVVNLFVGGLLRLLTLPLIVVTLGLFLLLINTAVLALTAGLSSKLAIDDFGTAFFAALIISVLSELSEFLLPLRPSPDQTFIS